jgi:hypothetical protein
MSIFGLLMTVKHQWIKVRSLFVGQQMYTYREGFQKVFWEKLYSMSMDEHISMLIKFLLWCLSCSVCTILCDYKNILQILQAFL